MGKAGEKQRRRPKLTDKKQSERFKAAARELGLDEKTDAFDRVLGEMALPTVDDAEHEANRRKIRQIEKVRADRNDPNRTKDGKLKRD
jgi:hypothetical protein